MTVRCAVKGCVVRGAVDGDGLCAMHRADRIEHSVHTPPRAPTEAERNGDDSVTQWQPDRYDLARMTEHRNRRTRRPGTVSDAPDRRDR